MVKFCFLCIMIIFPEVLLANVQEYRWTGNANDNDFFNEMNWEDPETGLPPAAGLIDPQKDIDFFLRVTNHEEGLIIPSLLKFSGGGLILENASLKGVAVSGGSIHMNVNGYLELSDQAPLRNGVEINLSSGIGWVRLNNVPPSYVVSELTNNIKIKQDPAVYQENLRIDNYYDNGSVIRMHDTQARPLTIYNSSGLNGSSADVTAFEFHNGENIPGNMNNKVASFILRKGYMVTMAVNADGTGLSKVFIASEKDLVVEDMPSQLVDATSFIRVLPWNWVSKKGIGGTKTGLQETWHYTWSHTTKSSIFREVAPMAWGYNGASESGIATIIDNFKATHAMGFNEPDDCHGQSGQHHNLCLTDVAVAQYRNLMKTGMRLVSPGTREEGALRWLKEFHEKATAQHIRIDVIAVHWYDWGSKPAQSPDASAQQIFNRFRNYLQNVYDHYQLPIWITEFNANIHRPTATQEEFMALALPYLESLDYVERYAWFEPSSGTGSYYDGSGNHTPLGQYYRDLKSTPSVVHDAWQAPANLDGKASDELPQIPVDPGLEPGYIFMDDFEKYPDGQSLGGFYTIWEGQANAVDARVTAAHGTAFKGDKFGRSNNTHNDFFLRKTFTLEPGKEYVWELATRMTDGNKHVMQVVPGTVYPNKECFNSEWELHSVEFTVIESNPEVTLSLYRWPKKFLYFDNFVLREKDNATAVFPSKPRERSRLVVYPNPAGNVLHLKGIELEHHEVKVYDLRGVKVLSKVFSGQIDISFLTAGLYLIKIGPHVSRFVKN